MWLPVLWPAVSSVKGWRPTSFAASDWLTPANPFPPSANQSGGWVTSRGNPLMPLKCAPAASLSPLPVPRTNLWEVLPWENFLKLKELITTRILLKWISHFCYFSILDEGRHAKESQADEDNSDALWQHFYCWYSKLGKSHKFFNLIHEWFLYDFGSLLE